MTKHSVGVKQTCVHACETDVSASGAVPQVCDVTQILGQVVFVLGLGGQLEVSAERIQPYRIRSTHTHTHTRLLIQCIQLYYRIMVKKRTASEDITTQGVNMIGSGTWAPKINYLLVSTFT